MDHEKSVSTHQKALRINLDGAKYGAFAEIGAGQEAARWFFHVGGAAGTVAKTISAYDMTLSDANYGSCQRYVSRRRLQTMLDTEYEILLQRLAAKRGDHTTFFVFADTIAARSFSRHEDGQGWMGIKFQSKPGVEPSQIIVHVQLLDRDNTREQAALGILGVNLIYGACYLLEQPEALMGSLLDEVTRERIEVDMIKFSGPAFEKVDNRWMGLHLVSQGLSDAAMFTAQGEVVQASEVLYKRPILVERGSFRPVTKLTIDLLECAREQFERDIQALQQEPLVIAEITMNNLLVSGKIDHSDFLERVDVLGALGKAVLISRHAEYYSLVEHLARFTNGPIGIALGVPSLREIFDEKYYGALPGGILESVGRLFKKGVKLYVYPAQIDGKLITAESLEVDPLMRHLYRHLLENNLIEALRHYDAKLLPVFPKDVLAKIQSGDSSWMTMVPPQVAQMIRERKYFGYHSGE